MAKPPDFMPELEELAAMVKETFDQSPNPRLPEEQERAKKAFRDRMARLDPDKRRALTEAMHRAVFDHIWGDLEKERAAKQLNSSVTAG